MIMSHILTGLAIQYGLSNLEKEAKSQISSIRLQAT